MESCVRVLFKGQEETQQEMMAEGLEVLLT